MVTETGVPMEFDRDHCFLIDVLRDQSPEIILAKAAQLGFSITFFLKGVFHCFRDRYNIHYSTTIDTVAGDMVHQKFDPITRANPILRQLVKDADSGDGSVHQKRFGAGFFTIFGSNSKSAPISLSADILMHDEWDRSNMRVLSEFRSRLEASSFKRVWRFGNPELPATPTGSNIMTQFERDSDAKHWFVECPACGKWQFIDWPESFCFERKVYQCLYCRAEITDEARRDGMWVRKYDDPSRASGYWAPLWVKPSASAKHVIEAERRYREDLNNPSAFWIFVAAKGYAPKEDAIPESVVRNAFQAGHPRGHAAAMGIDPGEARHYCMTGDRDGVHDWFSLPSFEEIANYIRANKLASVVIDGEYKTQDCVELHRKFPNIVKLAYYPTKDHSAGNIDVVRWDPKSPQVLISRTRAIDAALYSLQHRSLPVFVGAQMDNTLELIKHFGALYAVKEIDDQGNIRRRWVRNAPDHYAHCYVYLRAALERLPPPVVAADIPEGEPMGETIIA